MAEDVKLTQFTKAGGWGAKLGPGVLGKLLADLPMGSDERLMVGFDASDDAAVYRLDGGMAMIQTVDFFPPVVDDPYTFGQIAAANALSDVYAMGGAPRLAMNLLCFPNCLPPEAARDILAGGADKVREAGAVIAGGHSIEDSEPKYGLCVTGFAPVEEILTNSGAKPGDLFVLTKPLGTGILTTAAKAGLLDGPAYAAMTALMAALNRRPCEAMKGVGAHACTDVTGFGLLGHLNEVAAGSGVSVEVWAGEVPAAPGALELAREGIIPGGAYRNREYLEGKVLVESAVPLELGDILYDPQTAGGLLIAVPEARCGELLRRLEDGGVPGALIGEAQPRGAYNVRVKK